MTPPSEFERAYVYPNALWLKCETLAKGLDGAAVVDALARASSKVYDAGLDNMYAERVTLTPATVAAFDAGWLTVFAVELDELRERTRRRMK